MKRELSRHNLLNVGTSISAVSRSARASPAGGTTKAESKGKKAAPWRQVQMAAKKQPTNKLVKTAGQIDSAASKSARLADKISSGGREDSKNSSRARPDLNGTSNPPHC
jgi:hypothetical protein